MVETPQLTYFQGSLINKAQEAEVRTQAMNVHYQSGQYDSHLKETMDFNFSSIQYAIRRELDLKIQEPARAESSVQVEQLSVELKTSCVQTLDYGLNETSAQTEHYPPTPDTVPTKLLPQTEQEMDARPVRDEVQVQETDAPEDHNQLLEIEEKKKPDDIEILVQTVSEDNDTDTQQVHGYEHYLPSKQVTEPERLSEPRPFDDIEDPVSIGQESPRPYLAVTDDHSNLSMLDDRIKKAAEERNEQRQQRLMELRIERQKLDIHTAFTQKRTSVKLDQKKTEDRRRLALTHSQQEDDFDYVAEMVDNIHDFGLTSLDLPFTSTYIFNAAQEPKKFAKALLKMPTLEDIQEIRSQESLSH